jgi:periplasmic protein TonB
MNIKLNSYKLLFGILDMLSNSKCLHKLVINRKIYLGASILSLSLANNSCTSENKVTEDKTPDKKDSITKKPDTDSLVENKELKKDTLIRLVKNKHKVLAELTKVAFDNSTIEVASCYAPIDVVEVPDNEPEIYTVAEEMPQFIGGDDSLKKFITTNLVWPTEAQEVEGTVYVGFIVETTGALTDISVKKGAHYLLDKEAIRLVKNMPKWKSGKQNGKAVRVSFVIPIRFIHQ